MQPISVVGIGTGSREHLTGQARAALREADVVFGYPRHLELARGKQARAIQTLAGALDDMEAEYRSGRRVALMVSGDPTLYSFLGLMLARFGAEHIAVVPGIGAVQAFMAELKCLWQHARIVSAHGRGLTENALLHLVRTEKELVVFCDGQRGPQWMAQALVRHGMGDLPMQAGERLGYADARLLRLAARDMARMEFDALCMARIENPQAGPPAPPGLPDAAFIRGKTPMTKRDIRCLAVCDLHLTPDAVVWDIGAGTGSVSVEMARLAPMGTVYAVERDEEALSLIARNRDAMGLCNIEPVRGAAPEALRALPPPTHVFLGGGGREMDAIFDVLESLPRPIRFAAAFVTVDNAAGCLKRLDAGWQEVRARQVAVTELEKVGGYRMFRAQNPIFLCAASLLEEKA